MDTITRSGWSGTRLGKPEVGASAERRRVTRASDIIAFSDMTGDRNPIHYDGPLAARTVFGRLIVQGGVTSGLLNAVVAEDLPGPGSVFLGVEWKFVKAVGIGEEIVARAEVLTVREDKADLHPGDQRLERGGRDLPVRHRDDLHSAARLARDAEPKLGTGPEVAHLSGRDRTPKQELRAGS